MGAALRIYNQARERFLVSEGRAARSFWVRLRGLLGCPPLRPGEGLWIAPCNWIHTLGMGFSIDVLYLDRRGQILLVVSGMRPNRIGPLVWGADSVVELPAGAIEGTETRVGDWLVMTWAHQNATG